MVRFEPYVAILGGSDGYAVVCQSGSYVGLKRKILVQDASGGWRSINTGAPQEKLSRTRDYVIIGFNKARAVHFRVPHLGQLFDVLSCWS